MSAKLHIGHINGKSIYAFRSHEIQELSPAPQAQRDPNRDS
jgi:hypothetical protein